jgi:hypothetical protein
LTDHQGTVRKLGDVYEQLNAPFGEFAEGVLKASTQALQSSDESHYSSIEAEISNLTSQRDALAAQIRNALNAAAFSGQGLNQQTAKGWIDQAQGLIDQATALGNSS